jgi:MSHA pilin protein MshA
MAVSSAKLVYTTSLIKCVQEQTKTNIDLDGDDDVEVNYGYPSARRGNSISKIMDYHFTTKWTWSTTYGDTRFWLTTTVLGGRSGQCINQTAVRNSSCYILYDPAIDIGKLPKINDVTTNC